jgi:hypothetical protein
MGRRKSNIGEDLVDIGRALPWWANLLLAAGAYLLFHTLAGIETGAGTSTDIGYVIPRQVLRTASSYAQYGVPILLLLGALSAGYRRKRRAKIFDSIQSEGCPNCGSEMKLRTARKGQKAGSDFWGCSRYPKCRGTRSVA